MRKKSEPAKMVFVKATFFSRGDENTVYLQFNRELFEAAFRLFEADDEDGFEALTDNKVVGMDRSFILSAFWIQLQDAKQHQPEVLTMVRSFIKRRDDSFWIDGEECCAGVGITRELAKDRHAEVRDPEEPENWDD